MQVYQVQLLEPKAQALLENLASLKLIHLQKFEPPKLDFRQLLELLSLQEEATRLSGEELTKAFETMLLEKQKVKRRPRFGSAKGTFILKPGWDEPMELVPHSPVTPATGKPDLEALAGAWKDKDIMLEKLRNEAWGDLQGSSMPKGPVTLPPGFDEPLENYPAGFGGAKGMFVMSPDFEKLLENDPSGFGCLKGKIHLAPDWDEPLEDFKEYMY